LDIKKIGKIALMAAASLLLTASLPRIVSAGVIETVREDLRPISGYVVMQREGEYVVDLDARHGLRVGDLLSVVTKGPEVIHPVTKEVLGRLDEAKAVLQVTQIKSGFSLARPVSGSEKIADGEIVRRFAFLTAKVQGPAGSKARYEELRDALPELEWQGLFPAGDKESGGPKTDLVFTLENNELRLADGEGRPLRSWAYPVAAGPVPQQPAAVAARQTARPVAGQQASPPVTETAGKDRSPVRWTSGGADFGPFKNLGELPDRVLMSAFTRDLDRLLLATVDGEHMRVYAVGGGLRQIGITTVMQSGTVSPLAVSWWRPEKTGPLYLAVTAGEEISRNYGTRVETKLSGAVYELAGDSLRPVAPGLRYFLGAFDRDGDGQPETLLGQEFHLRDEYGRTFVLRMEGGKIRTSKPDFELPREFTVLGGAMGDLTGDGKPETAYVRNGILWIYTGEKRIYESSKGMGGSISTLTYNKNPDFRDTMFSVLSLEVPPFRQDIDGDGVPELLVVASDTGFLQVPGIGPGVKKSGVAVVKFQDGTFRKGQLPGELENPIQGIFADEKQVYLVVSRTTSAILGKEGSSSLLALPLGNPAR
jgi:hypothetical protein